MFIAVPAGGSFFTLAGSTGGVGGGILTFSFSANFVSCWSAVAFFIALRSLAWIRRSCLDRLLLDLNVCSQK